MLAEVQRMRRRGVRLKRGEVSEPVRGIFELVEDDGKHTSLKRQTWVATLYELVGVQETRRTLITMFDARVIEIRDNTIFIVGFELHQNEDKRLVECVQILRVRPVLRDPSTLPSGDR